MNLHTARAEADRESREGLTQYVVQVGGELVVADFERFTFELEPQGAEIVYMPGE
jgi:hypothetical protein